MPARNILLVLTDQERAAGRFESRGMAEFRASQLPRRRALAEQGITFAEHRIAASACTPSRASLFTGYTPHVHRVWQTDGFAKLHDDPAMTWLAPNRVPTLGHRFRAHGWDTVYFGKWHLSHDDGSDDPLAPYGFSGWRGPEPHGAALRNSGVQRDPGFVAQACDWLGAREQGQPPFLLVVSLVNPHDIVFWPAWSTLRPELLALRGIPTIGPAMSDAIVVPHEPEVLTAYRRRYPLAYGPRALLEWIYRRNPERYRRFYASLLRRTDAYLGQILDALAHAGHADSTSVVFSSDHGELLGAHGGLHQKWYNAFEETLRVPLCIRSPAHARRAGTIERVSTSHLDLVPTLLGLAGIDAHMPGAPALPGRDLFASDPASSTYFATADDVLAGASPESAFVRAFPRLGRLAPLRYGPLGVANTAVEAITARAEDGRYKLVRYHRPGATEVSATDEWSLFELDRDPCELHDLAADELHRGARERLAELMVRWRRAD